MNHKLTIQASTLAQAYQIAQTYLDQTQQQFLAYDRNPSVGMYVFSVLTPSAGKKEPEKFDISQWVTKSDQTGCGTVCCAIGWCPAVFAEAVWRTELSQDDLVLASDDLMVVFKIPGERDQLTYTGAKLFFNLTEYEFEKLFLGHSYGGKALPTDVASRIRLYCTALVGKSK